MKSFLCKNKKPIVCWTHLKENTFYVGEIPEGYSLGVCPGEYVVLDIDRHDEKNGFKHIPKHIQEELEFTLNYKTRNNGRHYWLKYTGDKSLVNRASSIGIDLRVGYKGYVIWYLPYSIGEMEYQIAETSPQLNKFLESLFYHAKK